MKNIFKKLLLTLALVFTLSVIQSQTIITNTVTWTSGWCNICGPQTGNYACNPPWSGSGTWNNGIRTFTTNIPAGNIVSGICVTVNKVNCGYTNLCVVINGVTVGCQPPTPPGNCNCGACFPETFCANYPCPTGLPGFVNNGTNTLQLVLPGNQGPICVNNAIITLTYQTCCPVPTLSVLGNTVICSGQTTTLTGTGAGPGGTYQWITPTGTVNGNPFIVSPTVTTTYTLSGTTNFPCTGTRTFQVLVNPTPTINPTSNSPVCQGSPINLNVNTPPGGTLVTYNWNGPNGYNSTFQNPQIPIALPVHSGIYTVTAINNFTNGGSCSRTNTTNVVVVPTNTIATTNPTLCQGSNLNLTANVAGASSFTWNGPNGFNSNQQNPQIPNILPVNGGIYTVTATFTANGTTLTCTSNTTSTVSVIATSPITLNIPTDVCQGATVNLQANAINNPSYNWTGPNGWFSNIQNPTLNNIQPSQQGIYVVNAVWTLGAVSCTISNNQLLNVVGVNSINVNSPINVCYPSNVQLTANAQGAVSYNWIASNGWVSNLPNPLLGSPTPTANGIYTVTATFSNGSLLCYNTNTTSVTVNPILPFNLDPYKLVCFNSSYLVNGPIGATSYTWTGPNNFSSNTQNLYINPVQPLHSGVYTLELNLGPCKTIGTTQLEVTTPITFTQIPTSKTICKGDTINVTVGSNGGSGVYAYNWNPGAGLGSTTGNFQIANPQSTTIYNITAYDVACPNYTINTSFAINVNNYPSPSMVFENGCEPLCLYLDSKFENEINSISWDFGNNKVLDGDKVNVCLDGGIYNLKVHTFGKNGCNGITNFDSIKVYFKPGGDFTYDPKSPNNISENKVLFHPTSIHGNKVLYAWSFGGGKDINESKNYASVVYDEAGIYPIVLISTNEWGCKDTVLKTIEIKEDYNCYIPNAFTPNGHDPNNQFYPVIYGAKEYIMSIFDRWGDMIFTGKNSKWDGTFKGLNCQDDVYVFKVTVTKNDGTRKEYVGHVTLLK